MTETDPLTSAAGHLAALTDSKAELQAYRDDLAKKIAQADELLQRLGVVLPKPKRGRPHGAKNKPAVKPEAA